MASTQPRAAGALTGQRYAGFAGKAGSAPGGHPVGLLTQTSAFGASTGRRYGPFAGRQQSSHPVGRLTVLRAHGAFSGARYSSFAGRAEAAPVLVDEAAGLNAIGPRRRVRRWPIHDAPAPAQLVIDVEPDDEEALIAMGLLRL